MLSPTSWVTLEKAFDLAQSSISYQMELILLDQFPLSNCWENQMRSQIWKCSEGVAWKMWPQYYYWNGLGAQNMKSPCHPIVFTPDGKPTNSTRLWERTLRLELDWGPQVCQGNGWMRAHRSSILSLPWFQWWVLDPWPMDFKTKKDQNLDNNHMSSPGSLQLLPTQLPDVSCDLLFVSFLEISGEGCEPVYFGNGPIHWSMETNTSLWSKEIFIAFKSIQKSFLS